MKVKDLSQLGPTRNVIYWRTTEGNIRKLILEGHYWIDCLTGIATDTETTILVGEFSKEIIDLIRVGDYVNGYKVIGVTLDPAPSGKYVDIDCSKPSYESYLFDKQIYSILTKEQYERDVFMI